MVTKEFPIYSVFTLILMISGNYLGELLPCRIRHLFTTSVVIKHIMAYLTILFFASLTDPYHNQDMDKTILTSVMLYLVFVLLSNTITESFFFCMFLGAFIFITTMYKKKLTLKAETMKNTDEREKIEKRISKLKKINLFGVRIFLVVAVTGFIMYFSEKKIEYGDKFSYNKFLLGTVNCKSTRY